MLSINDKLLVVQGSAGALIGSRVESPDNGDLCILGRAADGVIVAVKVEPPTDAFQHIIPVKCADGVIAAVAAGLASASGYFVLTAPSFIPRGDAFDLTIQAVDRDGDPDTSFPTNPYLTVLIKLLECGDDAILPVSTPTTGWTAGAKTVSCTIDGGTGTKLEQIKAVFYDREGSTTALVGSDDPSDQTPFNGNTDGGSALIVRWPDISASWIAWRWMRVDGEYQWITVPATRTRAGIEQTVPVASIYDSMWLAQGIDYAWIGIYANGYASYTCDIACSVNPDGSLDQAYVHFSYKYDEGTPWPNYLASEALSGDYYNALTVGWNVPLTARFYDDPARSNWVVSQPDPIEVWWDLP